MSDTEQAHLSRRGLRILHEAKLAEALDSTEAVMQNVVYSEGALKSTLGPTIVTLVKSMEYRQMNWLILVCQ